MSRQWKWLVGALILAGCRPAVVEQRPPEPTEEEIARVAAAADGLIKELGGRLISEMENAGPLGAIDVCSVEAQRIAIAHSSEDLQIRRVSLKVRNVRDVPDPWEAERLAQLEVAAAENDLPSRLLSVEEDGTGHELRYLKPLLIAPPCLNCHGDPATMDEGVVARLAELYPTDEAVGYEVGDLRGAVSVRLALSRGE